MAGNHIKCLIECFVQKEAKLKLTVGDVRAPDESHKGDRREIDSLYYYGFFLFVFFLL